MRILVTGANGQLGHDVCRELAARGAEALAPSSGELDIRDREQVLRYFERMRPEAAVHCAAYTQVDRAEEEPALCWAVNAEGTENMALACRENGAKLLYLSTDYVFSGEKEGWYEPEDAVCPQNIYGLSKLAGELAVKALVKERFIVRSSWLFGINGGNFVKTMLRLSESRDQIRVVNDQFGSPCYTRDLAVLLCDMIGSEKYGTYHAANEGICSWAEFAAAIFRVAGKNVRVLPVTTEEYAAKAARPKNSRLNKVKLAQNGFAPLPDWQDALGRYMEELNSGL